MRSFTQLSGNIFVGSFRLHLVELTFLLLMTVCISGCGDFFAEKPTELESKNILRELAQVTPKGDSIYKKPSVYTDPPRIVESNVAEQKDAKLFYFSRHHPVADLAKLVDEQFRKTFRDAKGKTYPVVDYTVSKSSATNQLIVRCPTAADAEQVLEFLEHVDVPPIQIKIDCLISEVYADHTMDWETTIEIDNLFGAGVSLGGKDGQPAFPGAALRDAARSAFGLKAGYVHQEGIPGHEFKALVDLLVSRGYLKILMNPQLEVVNGKRAMIETNEHVPLDLISNVHPISGQITQTTRYEDVKDSLEITATVYADGYIGIKTRALIGSKSTPDGVKQTPIVTKREINIEENRIREGESLIIGGIRKTEKRSVIRGVPFLKDIPILGVLFSSKDFEERGKEVLFILTPTISSGGLPHEDVYARVKEKHDMVSPGTSLMDAITDPFGTGSYTELIEEEATMAEVGRVKAEIEKSHVERRAQWLTDELRKAKEQADSERDQADRAQSELEKVKAESAAQTEAEKVKAAQAAALTEAEKQKTAKAVAETAKAKAEAQAAKTQLQQAQAEAQKAKAEAAKAKADAAKAKQQQKKLPPAKAEPPKPAAPPEAVPPVKVEAPKAATPPAATPPVATPPAK